MDEIKQLCAEALLQHYPASTQNLIKEMLHRGFTPAAIEAKARGIIRQQHPDKVSAVPEHFGLLAEYFQGQKPWLKGIKFS